MGALTFTPSFAPGFITEGDGKDLGHALNLNLKFNFHMNFQKSELAYLIIIYLMQV